MCSSPYAKIRLAIHNAMDSDTDADLARAIALSMEDAERVTGKAHLTLPAKTTKPKSTKAAAKPAKTEKKTQKGRTQNGGKQVLVISSEEEDLDPKPRADKAKPKSKSTSTSMSTTSIEKSAAMPPAPAPPAVAAGASPLSLADRAQVERERLARAKRVRGPSPPPGPWPRSLSPGSSDYEEEDEEGDAAGEDAEGEGESRSESSARKRARLDKGGGRANTLEGGAGKDGRKGKDSVNQDAGGRCTFPDGALLRVDTQHADASIPTSTLVPPLRAPLPARGAGARGPQRVRGQCVVTVWPNPQEHLPQLGVCLPPRQQRPRLHVHEVHAALWQGRRVEDRRVERELSAP
ncbi:hypothetical protein B0H19DRAFT_1238281 [Mycena capillaripes]|nr:hypothetical protein B0H19DRAFT_1238281 [Mycena capillaripes]